MIPRHLRNPRRAYDADGRERTPATVANVRANGAHEIMTCCTCKCKALKRTR
jgi:hypothetical protein